MINVIKSKKIVLALLISTLMIMGDVSYAFADTTTNPYEGIDVLPLDGIQNPNKVIKVLDGRSNSESLYSDRTRIKESHTTNLEVSSNGLIRDAGEDLHEYDPELSSKVSVERINEMVIEPGSVYEVKNVTEDVNQVKVPGLLESVIHTVNATGSGNVYLDSQAEFYNISTDGDLRELTSNNPETGHGGHFGIVVFVSDYKSRSIEKLQNNEVWRKTYSNLEYWLSHTSDYYAFLVNEYASPDNIMGFLAAAQRSNVINSIGITFVSHGVNSVYGHGVLIHHDHEPKKLGVMDGRIFRQALEKTGVQRISKLIHTNIHACFIIDEYEKHGSRSVLGFFEEQNYGQVLTGYRGLTYLNTKFVLSLENLLSAGTYILPTVTTRQPVVVTNDNNTVVVGEAISILKESFELRIKNDKDIFDEYDQQFDGDETLYVTDINVSPGDGSSSIYNDMSVYEHLNVPNSAFPTSGVAYNIEGHIAGAWSDMHVDDDNSFYFSRGDYQGYTEEFSAITDHWSTTGTVTSEDGYAKLDSGEELEESSSEVTSRNRETVVDILFNIKDDQSSGLIYFAVTGTRGDSLVPTGMGSYVRFGFSYKPSSNEVFRYIRGSSRLYDSNTVLEENRPYNLRITINGDLGVATLTTPDDPDFSISFHSTGFSDLINPRIFIKSTGPTLLVDRTVAQPNIGINTNPPSAHQLYEDQSLSAIKLSGSGGTADSTSEFVNGIQGLKAGAATSSDWLAVEETVHVGSSENRYLVFQANLDASVTDFELGLKFKDGSSYYTQYVEPVVNSGTYDDFVWAKGNGWQSYIVDLYSTFGYEGTIHEFSLQATGGDVYVDSMYITSDLSSAQSLAQLSLKTDEELKPSTGIVGELPENDVYYTFDDTLTDSSGNGNTISYYSTEPTANVDEFDDSLSINTANDGWSLSGDTTHDFHETGGKGNFYYDGGGSGWEDKYLSRSVSVVAGMSIETIMNFNYYDKMGNIRIEGSSDSSFSSLSWRIYYQDSWSGSSQSRVWVQIWDSSGNALVSTYTQVSGSSGQIIGTVDFASATSITVTNDHSLLSSPMVYSESGVRQTNYVRYVAGGHSLYYNPNMYSNIESYTETLPGGGTPSYTSGKNDNAIYLSGDEYLARDSLAPMFDEPFTTTGWVNPYDNQNDRVIWSSHNNDNNRFFLSRLSSGQLRLYYNNMGTIAESTTSLSTSTWNHFGLIYDGEYVKLYVNGKLEGSGHLGTVSSSNKFSIGQEWDAAGPSQFWFGLIDDFKIIKNAVSDDAIYNIYAEKGLERHYAFEEDGTDSTGNGDATSFPFSTVEGIRGNAVNFVGGDDIDIPDITVYRDHTMSLWIHADTFELDNNGDHAVPIAAGPTTTWYQVIDWRETAITIQDDAGAGYGISMPDVDNYIGTWFHLAIVFHSTGIDVYLNGEYQGTDPDELQNVLTLRRIGKGYSDKILNGQMDELRFYNGALSSDEVYALTQLGSQEFGSSETNSLSVADNPTTSNQLQVKPGFYGSTENIEVKTTVNGSDYGYVLDNGVWKELGTSNTVSELSAYEYEDYTIVSNVYQTYTQTGLHNWLQYTFSIDNVTIELDPIFLGTGVGIGNLKVSNSIAAEDGYLIEASMSNSDKLGSQLYADNAAHGVTTQGAFALKFEREVTLQTAVVTSIMNTYTPSNVPDRKNGLMGLIDDLLAYKVCGTVEFKLGEEGCDSGTIHNPGLYQSGGFEGSVSSVRGLNLFASNIKWQDAWFTQLFSDLTANGRMAQLEPKQIGGNHYFYYNEELSNLQVQVTVNNPTNQKFKLHRLDTSGNPYATYTEASGSSFTITISDPRDIQFFYLQMEHSDDISNIGLAFTPTDLTYNSAYFDQQSGEGSTVVLQSERTGTGTVPVSQSSVSYVEYRTESGVIQGDPIFTPLNFDGSNYWLNRMVVIGNLGETSSANPIGVLVDSGTYAESESTGEKLVAGSTYWGTTNGDPESTYTVSSTSGTHTAVDGKNYMYSFALQGRYAQTVDLRIHTTESSNVNVYLESDDEITNYNYAINQGTHSTNQYRDFSFFIGTTPTSIIIKFQARENSYQDSYEDLPCLEWEQTLPPTCKKLTTYYETVYVSPFLQVEMLDFDGDVGYYELVNDVEEFKLGSLTSNKVNTLVKGENFDENIDNERQDALVPPSARLSLETASETNPTKNRVFDVTLLLEQIVADFTYFKNSVKDKLFELLIVDSIITAGIDERFAKWLWSIVEEYGFGAIEKIINFFMIEDNQNRLTNVILGDPGLKQALNYGNTTNGDPLDYWAVAKAGILVFAQYIHDTLITANSWASTTWGWLMGVIGRSGDTLVDIVGAIWDGIGTAISLVKSAGSTLVNIVKQGLSFITDALIPIIISSIVLMGNTAIMGLMSLFNSLIPGSSTDFTNLPTLLFSTFGIEFGLIADDRDISFEINDQTLRIVDPLVDPSFETLSGENGIGLTTDQSLILGGHLISELLVTVFMQTIPKRLLNSPVPGTEVEALKYSIGAHLLAGVSQIVSLLFVQDESQRMELAELLSMFQLGNALGILFWLINGSFQGMILEVAKDLNWFQRYFGPNAVLAIETSLNPLFGFFLGAIGLVGSIGGTLFDLTALQSLPILRLLLLFFGMLNGFMKANYLVKNLSRFDEHRYDALQTQKTILESKIELYSSDKSHDPFNVIFNTRKLNNVNEEIDSMSEGEYHETSHYKDNRDPKVITIIKFMLIYHLMVFLGSGIIWRYSYDNL